MAIKIIPGDHQGSGFETKGDSLLSLFEPKAGVILTASIIFLTLSLLIWGGLWWYQNSIVQKTTLVTSRIDELQAQRDVEIEKVLIELDKSIKNLDEVLKDRIYPVNIFNVLEDLVLPEVFFSSFSSDVSEATVSTHVIAQNYKILAEQMIVFKESSRIENVEFNSINLGDEGNASADFIISLDPGLLKQEILTEL